MKLILSAATLAIALAPLALAQNAAVAPSQPDVAQDVAAATATAPATAADGAAQPVMPADSAASAADSSAGEIAESTPPMHAAALSPDAMKSLLDGYAALTAAKPGDAAAGAGKAAACVACHGIDGNSVDPQYPRIAGQGERFIARQLMQFKTGARQNALMTPFAAPLTPQDMRDLGAHFAAQSGRSGTADEGLVTEIGVYEGRKLYTIGQQIYRGGDAARGIPACMACHGPAGAGNPGSSFPRLTGQHAGYTEAMLKRYRAGETHSSARQDANSGIMPTVAAPLTDLEIGALATYIEGLHVYDPRATPASAQASAAAQAVPAAPANDVMAEPMAPADAPAGEAVPADAGSGAN